MSAPLRNPRKVAGLKTTILPCSWEGGFRIARPRFSVLLNGPLMRSRPNRLNQDPLGQRTGREPIDEALNF